ncbi:MAG: M20/M25/M40 family metallo-hydrolase, partial [Thermoanaerobaculia bacterium]|nr:M20/M25/M40 family metallo-hydrolase [Thermoanaerobaculia bacterium]
WLAAAHPELFDGVTALLNEGGANRVIGDRLVFWGVEVAQKRPLVVARQRARPRSTRRRLRAREPDASLDPGARAADRAAAALPGQRTRAALSRGARRPRARQESRSLSPARRAGRRRKPRQPPAGGLAGGLDRLGAGDRDPNGRPNVIAPVASAYVDIRLLPDTDAETFLANVRQALGEGVEVEVILDAPEVAPSPTDGPAWRALEKVLGVRGPLVPLMISGTTDSRYFRARGIPTYGFSPFSTNAEEGRGIHAPNESIPMEDFLRGVETMRRVVLALAEP